VANAEVFTPRADLAEDLWRYGEDELWTKALTASNRKMKRISELSLDHLLEGPTSASGDSMPIARALALAAVEVFEGEARPLKRNRRRPEQDVPEMPSLRLRVAGWLDVRDMVIGGR
jgi:hypothetical protein